MLAYAGGFHHRPGAAADIGAAHFCQQQRPGNCGQVYAGALLSRATAGDSPFGVSVTAAVTLVLLHRLLAYATYFFPTFDRLVKGESSILAERGAINHAELRRASFSQEALQAAVRGAANLADPTQAEIIRLEHDGTVTAAQRRDGMNTCGMPKRFMQVIVSCAAQVFVTLTAKKISAYLLPLGITKIVLPPLLGYWAIVVRIPSRKVMR